VWVWVHVPGERWKYGEKSGDHSLTVHGNLGLPRYIKDQSGYETESSFLGVSKYRTKIDLKCESR
jgi:hypothetical protein